MANKENERLRKSFFCLKVSNRSEYTYRSAIDATDAIDATMVAELLHQPTTVRFTLWQICENLIFKNKRITIHG